MADREDQRAGGEAGSNVGAVAPDVGGRSEATAAGDGNAAGGGDPGPRDVPEATGDASGGFGLDEAEAGGHGMSGVPHALGEAGFAGGSGEDFPDR